MNLVRKISDKMENKIHQNQTSNDTITNDTMEETQENSKRFPNRGIHFPWAAYFFIGVGFLSEVVDAFLLRGVLDEINSDGAGLVNLVISLIVGVTCFASMAFVGYQRGNRKIGKVSTKYAYFTWLLAGLALVIVRVWAGGLDDLIIRGKIINLPKFTQDLTIAVLQLVLYIGTGCLTRDSAEILCDCDIWEYRQARDEFVAFQAQVRAKRAELKEGISKLRAYPQYAERLIKSKDSVRTNIAQYNKSSRAVIEAKMATVVEPDLMEEMYDNAMTKERREEGK